MEILFVIFLVLFSSFIVTKLLQKINLPKVLGPILTGILFTIFNFTFSSDINLTLSSLSEIGAMLILFYIGLELNLKNLKRLFCKF